MYEVRLFPHWLVSFSDRFGLYGRPQVTTVGPMMTPPPKTPDPVEAFRERVVKMLRDLAESERDAHRGKFNHDAYERAAVFERAADMVAAAPREQQ